LQYVLAMFLAYPLSGILNFLPSANAKHAFSLLVGLWYAQEIFGNQVQKEGGREGGKGSAVAREGSLVNEGNKA